MILVIVMLVALYHCQQSSWWLQFNKYLISFHFILLLSLLLLLLCLFFCFLVFFFFMFSLSKGRDVIERASLLQKRVFCAKRYIIQALAFPAVLLWHTRVSVDFHMSLIFDWVLKCKSSTTAAEVQGYFVLVLVIVLSIRRWRRGGGW